MVFIKQSVSLRKEKVLNHLKSYHSKTRASYQDFQEEKKETDKEDDDRNIKWNDGRRIVDLGLLANALESCVACKSHLNLNNVGHEKRNGLGSYLHVRCNNCGFSNVIPTNKTHYTGSRGPGTFDINTKAALGVADSGIAIRQFNKLMTDMGIPGITPKSMKKREREIKKPIYDVTKDSCLQAIDEEIEEMRKTLPLDEPATPMGFKAKYDMCWQKRGSGRSYSSPSGVGTFIGQYTGKIMTFGICSTLCRICDTAVRLNKTPVEHDCPKNWNKSAKAMEADTAARLLKYLEDSTSIQVDTLIMDDDSSTLARVKQTLAHDVEKWSDVNHSSKSVSNSLYSLQHKHKVLSSEVIKYLKRCFSYAIHQNKDNTNGLKDNLLAIVPHAFGIHEKCGVWCKHDTEHDIFKSLPNKKPLSGDELFKDLCVIFKTMSNNAHKLSPCGSTKDVESLHNIYAARALKRICYDSNETLSIRINTGVSQQNLGYDYVSHVNEKAGLSPSKITKNYTAQLQN